MTAKVRVWERKKKRDKERVMEKRKGKECQVENEIKRRDKSKCV